MMNLTLSEEGKKLGFKEFVKVFGKHFKSFPQPQRDAEMQKKWTQLTGKKLAKKSGNTKKSNKHDQSV